MRVRRIALGLCAGVLALTAIPGVWAQAQAKRVVRVVATSYKFEPSLIQVRAGETVVLQIVNADAEGRNHSIAAQLFTMVPVVARGDIFRQGTAEGRRFFAVEPGKQIEVEFVASVRGSFPFICGISDHAAKGQVGAINVLQSD